MIVDSVMINAKAYFKGEIIDCCFAVEDGRIRKIGKETNMPKADQKIDLRTLLVLPGVIDSHVHLRDEDNSYKETFLSGTAAAAAGGVTTVLDMPNNAPITMNPETLRNRMGLARPRILVNLGFYSEFPKNGDQISAVVDEGAVGFKLFLAEQVGGVNIDDDDAIKEVLRKTGEMEVPVAIHAEDHNLLKRSVERLKFSNRDNIAAFLKAHSEQAELAAVERILGLIADVEKARVHFCHLSTKKALETVAAAKESGKSVTCEVTPQHLLLTRDEYERVGSFALTMPPLRDRENVAALWDGIDKGVVDTIGSDHAPHTVEEKEASSIWDVKAGIPGLETTLPLAITAIHQGRLTLRRAVELLSEKPSKIFGIHDRGRFEEGNYADLVVVDFNAKFRIEASNFKSKAKFSPFDKWEVQGKPLKTFVNGVLVMEEDDIVAKPGVGSVVRRI